MWNKSGMTINDNCANKLLDVKMQQDFACAHTLL